MLPFHSDTHLPKPTPPPSRAVSFVSPARKIKTGQPTFFSVVVFLSPLPFFLPPHQAIGLCLSVFLSSSHSPWSLHGSRWESRHALGCIPPPQLLILILLLLPSFVSHRIPQMTAASTHSHFHLCISRGRQCVVCMWRRYISTPIKGYSWRYYAWCSCTDPVMGGEACLLVILCCW